MLEAQGANKDIASNIRVETAFGRERIRDCRAVTEPVSLKVLSWNVAGLSEDSTDIFLSQISMLTDWDVLLLQECFRKMDGVNVGAHELFTPSELMGGLRCPAVIVNQKWSGQLKIVGGVARWTAVELDGQLTFISAHLPRKVKKL